MITKSITFDKKAQDELPQHIKDKMKADREKAVFEKKLKAVTADIRAKLPRLFTAKAYRATRLVVMPEWQGAGVGTAFLNEIMQYHLEGNGRKGYKYHTFFHTSHPQLCGYLRHSKKWVQTNARLYGANKKRCIKSILKTGKGIKGKNMSAGYGGHFRAVQAFKYLGK